MTKTFNIELWERIKEDFEDLNEKVYFGEAPVEIETPFCVVHVLDCGVDESYNTTCSENKIYMSDIQISLYAQSDMYIDELLTNLNVFLEHIKLLDDYRIITYERNRTRNANGFASEIGMGFTEYTFTYEKL